MAVAAAFVQCRSKAYGDCRAFQRNKVGGSLLTAGQGLGNVLVDLIANEWPLAADMRLWSATCVALQTRSGAHTQLRCVARNDSAQGTTSLYEAEIFLENLH